MEHLLKWISLCLRCHEVQTVFTDLPEHHNSDFLKPPSRYRTKPRSQIPAGSQQNLQRSSPSSECSPDLRHGKSAEERREIRISQLTRGLCILRNMCFFFFFQTKICTDLDWYVTQWFCLMCKV